jgi:hypothetical protein
VTHVFEVGGRRIGVRWSEDTLPERLRDVVGTALDPASAPPNISILVGARHDVGRSKHQMYVQGEIALIASRDGRLVRGVLRAISCLADRPSRTLLSVKASLVITADGKAIAVDRMLMQTAQALEAGLRRRGATFVDLPILRLDAVNGSVLMPDTATMLAIDRTELEARWPQQEGDDDLRAGPVSLDRVVVRQLRDPQSRSAAVAMMPLLLPTSGRVNTEDVRRLVQLSARVELIPVQSNDVAALRRALGMPDNRQVRAGNETALDQLADPAAAAEGSAGQHPFERGGDWDETGGPSVTAR